MKVFISWSGPRSKMLARALNDWIPNVVQGTACFYSNDDIHAGQRWNEVISGELSNTDFGILCVTAENLDSRWLNFEAGALSKKVDDESRVVPVTLGFSPQVLQGPLNQFNGIEANEEGALKLVRSIDIAAEAKINIEATVELWWPKLKDKIDEIPDSEEGIVAPEPPDEAELLTEILSVVRGIAQNQNTGYSAALPFGVNHPSSVSQATAAIARVNEAMKMQHGQSFTEYLLEDLQQNDRQRKVLFNLLSADAQEVGHNEDNEDNVSD